MTVYNQDPDVLRWGLHLLDVCSISNAGSCGTVTQYDPDLSSVEFVREGYVEAEQPNVENDQRLALALQEALSQVSLEEASGASTHGNEQFQASVLIQDWRAPLKRYSDAEGRENGNKQAGYVETEQPSVKNDELTAHAFKELSPLSLEEASGASTSGNEQLQASVLTQDRPTPLKSYSEIPFWMFLCGLFVVFLYWLCWLCWLCCNLLSFKFFRNKGRENGQQLEDQKEFEIRDEVGKAYSCSSPGEKSGSDDDVDMLHLADESVLDGEVGKRLNQMVPVPHVPKINGEIPSVEDEVSNHQRLLDRLQLYNLVENKVQGDGNCQFRALSDQLYRTPEHHEFVRRQIVQQLKSCPQMYDGYVPMAFGDYLKKMSKSGEWGDHVTLQAAADSYGVKIFVITSFKDTCYIEILPHVPKSKRVIFLSFWAEVHYNSIYPE